MLINGDYEVSISILITFHPLPDHVTALTVIAVTVYKQYIQDNFNKLINR